MGLHDRRLDLGHRYGRGDRPRRPAPSAGLTHRRTIRLADRAAGAELMSQILSTASGSTFDAHTAVQDDVIGPWRADIAPELSGFAGTHGGYVAAIALRAMMLTVRDPQRPPRSLTVHLL